MKLPLAMVMAAASLLPSATRASCIVEAFQPQLESADVVFVGTVIASRLARPLSELDPEDPRDQPAARLEVQPQIVLKGTPASIPEIRAATEYTDPRLGKSWEFSEAVRLAPGDTVLIVGQSGEPVFVGLCAASRQWDADTQEAVRAVFSSVP